MRAVTSASNINRRALCPGSERMERDLPEDTSPQSMEGTLLHEYDANPALIPAMLTPDQRGLLELSRRLSNLVFEEVSKVYNIGTEEPFIEEHEKTLHLHRGIKALFPGHCDLWRFYPNLHLLVIIDKKFGYREVTPASSNYQLRSYAVMGTDSVPAESVVVAITQPRLAFERRVTMASYTKEDLVKSREELLAIHAAAQDPDAALVAGEEQCRYCKAALGCDAYKAKFLGIKERAGQAVTKLTDEQLDQVLQAVQFADFIKDDARDEARRRVMAGELGRWKIGAESKVPSIVDTEVAFKLLRSAGLTDAQIFQCAKLTVGKLEDAFAGKGMSGKDAKDRVRIVLEPVINWTPRMGSLTRKKVSEGLASLGA